MSFGHHNLEYPFPLRGVQEVPTAPERGPAAYLRLRRKSAIGNHYCRKFARLSDTPGICASARAPVYTLYRGPT
eukprot:scaffold5612_cov48-Phaeocystis_antarctica.AAC.1